MKNVHVLPKDKPSRFQHIYITSDEQIKEGDWVIAIEGIWKNTITKITGTPITDVWMKIILTTDPDLLGVQSIDNEFLEWFVKNPSCEEVEVQDMSMQYHDEGYYEYKIIIPQEEAKQETLEGAADRLAKKYGYYIEGGKVADFVDGVVRGAEWQAERTPSIIEEYLETAFISKEQGYMNPQKWFEQFKNK